MSEILKKPYEISIWEDRLMTDTDSNETYYDEVKIAVIGSDKMTSKSRVYSPVFTINTNGEKTLTFSLKYKYYDEIVGDFVVNPFYTFLVNERKVKLLYKNEWHDFVIKERDEESEEYTFTYTCTDAFVQELSKNGYNITFDTELANNQGTIIELANKTLENTDWIVNEEESDILQQMISEPIYRCEVGQNSFRVLNVDTNEHETITAGEIIYIFYTYINNKLEENVQFLRAADQENWSYDDNKAIIGTNYRIEGKVIYTESSGSISINYGSAAISVGPVNYEHQGYRLVYGLKTLYDPVFKQTVNLYQVEYNNDTQDIYSYIDAEYGTSSLLTNFVTNGSNFDNENEDGITGWSNKVSGTTPTLSSYRIATYPEISATSSLAKLNELDDLTGYLEFYFPATTDNKYANAFYNSGISDNASTLQRIANGEKFLLRFRHGTSSTKQGTLSNPGSDSKLRMVIAKYSNVTRTLSNNESITVKAVSTEAKDIYVDFTGSSYDANVYVTDGRFNDDKTNYIINNVIQTPSKRKVYQVIENNQIKDYIWDAAQEKYVLKTNDNFLDYRYIIGTAKKSINKSTLTNPNSHIGLFLYYEGTSAAYVYVEEIELTKYRTDVNDNPIFLGAAPEAKVNMVNYYYLAPGSNDVSSDEISQYKDLNSLASDLGVTESDIEPVYNENCEKILSINEKQSNCFNILQTLCETFECWLKIQVEHEENGKIKLDENHNPLKQVTFKKYVGKNNFAGFRYGINLSSVSRTIDSNEFVTKLIVGQSASDYTDSGVLNIGEATSSPTGESYILNFDYYLKQGLIENEEEFKKDVLKFNQDLKERNNQIRVKNKELILISNAHIHAQSQYNDYADLYDSAIEEYNNQLDNFKNLVNESYESYTQTHTEAEIAKNDTVREAINKIYAAAIQVKNYQSLLESVEKEYKDLDIKYNGAKTYSLMVSTSNNEGTEGTKIVLSDYFKGFECTLSKTDETEVWASKINEKDFTSEEIYTELIIQKIPENYELEYISNNSTIVTDLSNPLVVTIYDNAHTAGLVKRFKLKPTSAYESANRGLKNIIDDLIEEKQEIENEFYRKYSRFIQEGTWESTDYIDPELYYLDAVQVSNSNAQPQLSYTINVIEVSEIEGLENYEFNVGDKTYIEDTDFFGWEIEPLENGTLKTPVKEEVIVSEVEWHLDEPETNVITIQNYKTQFADLFQRINATVQSVQYNQAAYTQAASIFDENGNINTALLVNSINSVTNSGSGFNIVAGGAVRSTDEGLIIQNLTEPANLLIIKGRGIEKSNDGGYTWSNLISSKGINTEELIAGKIDTQNIIIMDGDNPSFRWDKAGLNAYGYSENGSYDLKTYVRYDKYGLYGIQNGEDYIASSLEDIKENANFGLTWDGFFIKNKYRDGYVSISSDEDFQVVANDTERIKIGHFNDTGKYGIRIRNNEGNIVLETNDMGNISIAGTIRAADGEIGGFTIGDTALYNGEFGTPGSIYLSTGYPSQIPIAGFVGVNPWAIGVGHNFGVDIQGNMYATNARIRGTIEATDGYFTGRVDAVSGTFTNEIHVGDGQKYVLLKGGNNTNDSLIASSDYDQYGPNRGWAITGIGDAIFNNVSVRGAIKTAVFEYGEIEAVGGAFLFRPSASIKQAKIDGNDLIITVEKPYLFKVGEWVKVSNVNTESTNVNSILNDGGLTHVYKITQANGKKVRLEGAARDFISGEGIEGNYDGWGYETVNEEDGTITYSTVEFTSPIERPIINSPAEENIFEEITVSGQTCYQMTQDQQVAVGKTYYDLQVASIEDDTINPSTHSPTWYDLIEIVETVGQEEIIRYVYQPTQDTEVGIITYIDEDTQEEIQEYKPYYYFTDTGQLTQNDKTTYVDLKDGNRYISLNAPKYEVYFNGTGYIKNLNFEIRNNGIDTPDICYNEVIIDNWADGGHGSYIIHKYIGNLNIAFPDTPNTAEDFLVAEVTDTTGAQSVRYTRIYSDLNGEIEFELVPYTSQDFAEDLAGGSLISFGYDGIRDKLGRTCHIKVLDSNTNPMARGMYELTTVVESGQTKYLYVLTEDTEVQEGKVYYEEFYNYGIGINSSDNYVNLPARAISLFESEIHPTDTIKVTYDYKGILGTLPPLGNTLVNSNIYSNMAGTQGIFTNNMYIGDSNQYLAFYTDGQNQKHLKIKANELIFEVDDQTGHEVTWEEHIDSSIDEQIPIRVEIESSVGNMFLRNNISTTLTCTVYKGNEDITYMVTNFNWSKQNSDGTVDTSWSRLAAGRSITITDADVASKAIFTCTVEF